MIGLVVSLAAGTYVMARVDPGITLVALLSGIVIFWVTTALGSRIDAYRWRSREATGRVSSSLGEFLGVVQVLQVANAEERARGHFDRLSDERRRTDLKEGIIDALLGSVSGGVVTIITGVVLLAAAQQMRMGSFTVGDFALFVSIVGRSRMAWTLQQIGELLAALRRASVSVERLLEIMPESFAQALFERERLHLRGAIPEEPYPTKTALHRLESLDLEGMTYAYPEAGRGVNRVDLKLRRGLFTVLIGRIGSGKTTFLKVMLGLLPMDAGRVLWNGEIISAPRTFLVPPRGAYTPQTPWLFSAALRENILMGLHVDDKEQRAAVRLGVMEHDVAERGNGLDALVGSRGVKLSGGRAGPADRRRADVR